MQNMFCWINLFYYQIIFTNYVIYDSTHKFINWKCVNCWQTIKFCKVIMTSTLLNIMEFTILLNQHSLPENKHCHLAGRLMRKRIIKTPSFPWMLQHNSLSTNHGKSYKHYTTEFNRKKCVLVNWWQFSQIQWIIDCDRFVETTDKHSGKKFEYERERVDDSHLQRHLRQVALDF